MRKNRELTTDQQKVVTDLENLPPGDVVRVQGKHEYLMEKKRTTGGNYAHIHRGVLVETGQPVAIKHLKEADVHNPVRRLRLTLEARVLERLKSVPSVVHLIELIEPDEGSPLAVMEYLNPAEYQSLRRYLKEHGPMGFAEAIEVLTDIAAVVDAGHAQGIYHADLNWENIMIRKTTPERRGLIKKLLGGVREPRTKVVDLGASPSVLREKQDGTVGTPIMMAPERFFPGKVATQEQWYQSELYSLTILFLEMVMGDEKLFPRAIPVHVMNGLKAGMTTEGRIFDIRKFPKFEAKLREQKIDPQQFDHLINQLLYFNLEESNNFFEQEQYTLRRVENARKLLQLLKTVCKVK